MEDSAWNQVKAKSFTISHDGMTRIVSALISNHQRGLLAETINQLTLALIAPLGTNKHCNCHGLLTNLSDIENYGGPTQDHRHETHLRVDQN
jgi:hypothetical protein